MCSDGIFSGPTHEYPMPSGRNLVVVFNKIVIVPHEFVERLISVSLLHQHEVIEPVRAKNGVYHADVRYLCIMTDVV